MPTSNYEQFDVKLWNSNGQHIPLADYGLKVWDATNNTGLSDVTTDSNGVVAAGTVDVPAGTRIRFRVENYNGMADYYEQVTT